ncbi:MAG: hypothetical protein ACRC2J_17960 [Microcoleaceae cyanobacterium]
MNNNQGFGIIIGICVGVVFALGFIALDYDTSVSIFLGILGGIASGFLTIWLNTEAIAENKFLLEEDDLPEGTFSPNTPDNLSQQPDLNNKGKTEKTVNYLGSPPPFSTPKDVSLWQWLFKNNQRRF